jgi:hypothetical protein
MFLFCGCNKQLRTFEDFVWQEYTKTEEYIYNKDDFRGWGMQSLKKGGNLCEFYYYDNYYKSVITFQYIVTVENQKIIFEKINKNLY